MIRRTLIALACLAPLSAPAFADALVTGGVPLSSTSSFSASNTAAGIGNVARQNIFATQKGARLGVPGFPGLGGGPLVGNNSATLNNTAAGIGNKAVQNIDLLQKTGRGGALAQSNSFDASNLAAGIGNFAKQNIFATQR